MGHEWNSKQAVSYLDILIARLIFFLVMQVIKAGHEAPRVDVVRAHLGTRCKLEDKIGLLNRILFREPTHKCT